MSTRASGYGRGGLQEEPTQYGKPPRTSKPQILVLEERSNALYEPARALQAAGYHVQAIFEEVKIVDKIRGAVDQPFLLLTAHHTSYPLRVPQIIETLRRDGYECPMVYCVKGRVSSEMRSAYEALTVSRVLSLPTATRPWALDALAWASERVDWSEGGVTILEV